MWAVQKSGQPCDAALPPAARLQLACSGPDQPVRSSVWPRSQGVPAGHDGAAVLPLGGHGASPSQDACVVSLAAARTGFSGEPQTLQL